MILWAVAALFVLPAAAQSQEAFPSYIQVNGQAEKEIAPDEFYLAITIDESDSKGKISVETQQRNMIAALKRNGVDVEKQLTISDLSSSFFKRKTSVATANYQLKLTSSQQVTKVWQALDALGISNVNLQRVANSKIAEYRAQVRKEAMQNAQQTAQALAEAIGQKVGKCFYIYDSSNDEPIYYQPKMMLMRANADMSEGAEAEEEPLDFKMIKVRHSVQTKFVLQ